MTWAPSASEAPLELVPPADVARGRVVPTLAVALGFVAVSCVEVLVTLSSRSADPTLLEVRGLHLAYLVGYRAALALVLVFLTVTVVQAMRYGVKLAAGLLVAISLVAGRVVLADDLYSYTPVNQWLYGAALGLVPAGVVGLRALAGVAETRWPSLAPWLLRTPFAAAGVAAALINQLALPFGKAGLHLGLVVTSGVAFAMAFVGAPFAAVTSGRRMAGGGSWRGFS